LFDKLGAALLNMAVFGAVISYSIVMVSYIKLKLTRPDLPRPYKSPLGIAGAVVGTLLALLALGAFAGTASASVPVLSLSSINSNQIQITVSNADINVPIYLYYYQNNNN
jgi:amino acid transporter